ncbi:MAG: MFS transporter, partial [Actinomycetes bacterium]
VGFGLTWGIGATVAAVLALAMHDLGASPGLTWRVVLAAGAIPAAVVILLRRRMPETARFLGRIAGDGDATSRVLAGVAGSRGPVPGALAEIGDPRPVSYWMRRMWRQFAVACGLWFLFDIVAYSGILFGPSLIAQGLGVGPASFQLIVEGAFVLPGALIAVLLIDRVGRKPLQILGFLGMAVSLGGFALYRANEVVMVPVVAFAIYGMQNLASQAGPGSVSASGMLGVELAPTKVRGWVQALTVASGRLGAALTAFVFPSLFARYGESVAIGFLALLAVIAAVLTLVGVPETRRRSLEQSSGEIELCPELHRVPVGIDG